MRRFRRFGHPAAWLGLLALAVLGVLWLASELEPTADSDTETYLRAARAPSATLLLANIRTAGYPLLLRWVAPAEEQFWRLPLLHALVYLAAVMFFWLALRRFAGSGWLAFAAAVPLLFSDVLGLVHRIRPDVLAVAAALATVSFLLLLVRPSPRGPDAAARSGESGRDAAHSGRPHAPSASPAGKAPQFSRRAADAALWTGLTLSLFVTCQLRPSYLLFVPLVPLLGMALTWCAAPDPGERARSPGGSLSRRVGAGLRRRLGVGLGFTLAAFGPLVAFAALRWALVGHFGLVAFGGFNLIGTTASFLDPEVVDELPARHREVAAGILARRAARGWEPLVPGAAPRDWHPQYNTNVWSIALEALAEKYGVTARQLEDWVEAGELAPRLPAGRGPWLPGGIDVNQELSDLSKAVIRRRPGLYLGWVAANVGVAFEKVLLRREVLWPAALVALSLVAAPLLRRRGPSESLPTSRPSAQESAGSPPVGHPQGVPDTPEVPSVGKSNQSTSTLRAIERDPDSRVEMPPGRFAPPGEKCRPAAGPDRRLLGLGLLAVGWCLALLAPLILISIPFDRYIVASVLLIPGALFASLFEIWRPALEPPPM